MKSIKRIKDMKKIFSFIALLAGVTMLTSCGNDDATYTPVPVLEVSNADVLFEAEGGTGSITVNASGNVAAVVESGSWLSASVNGNTVNLSAPLNSSLNGRSAKVVITADGNKAEVTATQKGSVYGLAEGWEYTVTDAANASVNVPVVHTESVIVESLTEWLTARFNDATSNIEVVAQSNESEKARVGYVAFKTGIISDTIAVVQKGIVFVVNPATLSVSSEGSSETVTIQHSRPVQVIAAPEWVELKGADKAGTLTMTITIAENTGGTRTGEITLTSGPLEKKISIAQAGAEAEEGPTFADEVYGQYAFVYYDAFETEDWYYYDTEITAEGLTIYFPTSATVTVPYTIPLDIDNVGRQVKAGPNGSYLGTFADTYYVYLGWLNMTTGLSPFDVRSMAIGTLSTEEEDGELTTYLEWGGTFGDQEIEGWVLQAHASPEYSADSYIGGLSFLVNPYMMKLDSGEDAAAARRRAPSSRVIYSRGHKVYPAKTSSHGPLKQMK